MMVLMTPALLNACENSDILAGVLFQEFSMPDFYAPAWSSALKGLGRVRGMTGGHKDGATDVRGSCRGRFSTSGTIAFR